MLEAHPDVLRRPSSGAPTRSGGRPSRRSSCRAPERAVDGERCAPTAPRAWPAIRCPSRSTSPPRPCRARVGQAAAQRARERAPTGQRRSGRLRRYPGEGSRSTPTPTARPASPAGKPPRPAGRAARRRSARFGAPVSALDARRGLPAARRARARAGRRTGGDGDAGRRAGRPDGRRDRLRPGRRRCSTAPAPARVELGLSNIEFQVIGAEWIDLPLASVDAVLCRWGYMLLADPPAALSRDPPRAAPGRTCRAGRVGRRPAQPLGAAADPRADRARPHLPRAGAGHARAVRAGRPRARARAARAGRLRRDRRAGARARAASPTFEDSGRRRSTSPTPSTTPCSAAPSPRSPRSAPAWPRALSRTPSADGTLRDPRAHARRLRERLSSDSLPPPCSTTTTQTSRSSTARPSRSSATAPRATPTRST